VNVCVAMRVMGWISGRSGRRGNIVFYDIFAANEKLDLKVFEHF